MSENRSITYEDARRMDRADSLLLGVPGRDAAAAARRLEVAENLAAEWNRVADEAYRSSHWTQEPSIPEPFGLSAIIKAGGDVQAVVGRPDFDHLVLEDLGLGGSETVVSDEDGTRYEWVSPSADDWDTARSEAVSIRRALAARGHINPTAPLGSVPQRSAEHAGTAPHEATAGAAARPSVGQAFGPLAVRGGSAPALPGTPAPMADGQQQRPGPRR